MSEPDVIVDLLQRVKAKVDLPDTVATEVEAEARRYWGGERCYVAKAGESPVRRDARERAEAIRADFRKGERVKLLARRYELTERHVRRILGIVDAVHAPDANDARRPLPEKGGIARRNRRGKPAGPDIVLP